jgi:integrase
MAGDEVLMVKAETKDEEKPFHIAKLAVEALQPDEKGDRVYYDDKIRGFGVRVTKAGVKSYILNYHANKCERRFTIGRCDEMAAVLARSQADKLRLQIANGADPQAEKKAEKETKKKEQEIARAEKTLAELADTYVREYAMKNNRPRSVLEDQRMLAQIIIPKFGKMKVSADVKHDVELLHASLKKTKYRANRVLSLLSSMFKFAVDHKLRTDNPAHGIKRYREDRREAWLQGDELHALADALDAYQDQNAADAIRLLILTGSRPDEVMGAEWPMFDLQRGFWNKPSHHVKQKKDEHLPLNEPAMAILRRMWQDRDTASIYLFPASGDPKRHRASLRNCWRAACKDAGLSTQGTVIGRRGKPVPWWRPKYRLYDLRHSFASHLVNRGASLFLVGKLMGHALPATTSRYAHAADSALREVANQFPVIQPKALAS